MIGGGGIRTEVLKIEDLELARLSVVERHGVAYIAHVGLVVGVLHLGIGRGEIGACRPVFLLCHIIVAAACRQWGEERRSEQERIYH